MTDQQRGELASHLDQVWSWLGKLASMIAVERLNDEDVLDEIERKRDELAADIRRLAEPPEG